MAGCEREGGGRGRVPTLQAKPVAEAWIPGRWLVLASGAKPRWLSLVHVHHGKIKSLLISVLNFPCISLEIVHIPLCLIECTPGWF